MLNFYREQHKEAIHNEKLNITFMFVFMKNIKKKNISLIQNQLEQASNNMTQLLIGF